MTSENGEQEVVDPDASPVDGPVEPEGEAAGEPAPELKAEPETETHPQSEPESETDPQSEPEPEPETELEVALRERGEYLELAQRTRAELENFRKRAARESADAETRGRSGLARNLLPAIDNLERALTAAGVEPEGGEIRDSNPPSEEVSAHRALAEGVALVYRELRSCLERAGVVGYDPIGESFDPTWHEAVATISPPEGSDPVAAGTVLETLEKGYRLGEQSLRPARVVVSE